jgi:FdhD protein
MPKTTYTGLFYNNGNFSGVKDELAVEESLGISVNGEAFTVTMRSPGNEEELITGLLYTEEVYQDKDSLPKIETLTTNDKGYITEVNVVLPPDKILKDFAGSRNLISASSCGLCGRTSFKDTISKQKITSDIILDPAKIFEMFATMRKQQEEFQRTGGTHASAAFTSDGELLEIKEDIGRHNAVDKVIGGLIINNRLEQASVLLVSGRVSYEIVNKALAAGIPVVASVSAPSTMAVNNATEAGMTLIAFCRDHKLTVYSHAERILKSETVEEKI